jgi:hypothetical protein
MSLVTRNLHTGAMIINDARMAMRHARGGCQRVVPVAGGAATAVGVPISAI